MVNTMSAVNLVTPQSPRCICALHLQKYLKLASTPVFVHYIYASVCIFPAREYLCLICTNIRHPDSLLAGKLKFKICVVSKKMQIGQFVIIIVLIKSRTKCDDHCVDQKQEYLWWSLIWSKAEISVMIIVLFKSRTNCDDHCVDQKREYLWWSHQLHDKHLVKWQTTQLVAVVVLFLCISIEFPI